MRIKRIEEREDYDRGMHPAEFLATPRETLLGLMEEHGMTQTELRKRLGLSRTTISQICGGTRGISKQSALRLAEHFKLDVRAFLA